MDSMQSSADRRRGDSGNFRQAGNAKVSAQMRFRYGYICRLIDDNELRDLPASLRSRTRSFHKSAYWKSLSLLRRDSERILKLRREKMAALEAWDFQLLVSDYARIQMLLAKLTLAGLGHSIRLAAGLEGARQACLEFEAFLASTSSSASLAATA